MCVYSKSFFDISFDPRRNPGAADRVTLNIPYRKPNITKKMMPIARSARPWWSPVDPVVQNGARDFASGAIVSGIVSILHSLQLCI